MLSTPNLRDFHFFSELAAPKNHFLKYTFGNSEKNYKYTLGNWRENYKYTLNFSCVLAVTLILIFSIN